MNGIWKTEAEVLSILCPERAHQGVVSNEMCFNRGVRLARGVRKREPHKAIKWARLSRAFWARSIAGSGEPWQLLGERNVTTPHTKFYCTLTRGHHDDVHSEREGEERTWVSGPGPSLNA